MRKSALISAALALLLSGCDGGRESSDQPGAGEAAVTLATPQPGARIGARLRVAGEAPGYWFFEAVLPVELLAEDGRKLIDSYVEAQGEWMTSGPVRFDKTFAVPSVPQPTAATLLLRRNNASGLPEHDAEHRVAIRLVPSDAAGGAGDDASETRARSRFATMRRLRKSTDPFGS